VIVNYYLIFYAVKSVAPLASFHKMLTCVNIWKSLKLVENEPKGGKSSKRQFFRQMKDCHDYTDSTKININ